MDTQTYFVFRASKLRGHRGYCEATFANEQMLGLQGSEATFANGQFPGTQGYAATESALRLPLPTTKSLECKALRLPRLLRLP